MSTCPPVTVYAPVGNNAATARSRGGGDAGSYPEAQEETRSVDSPNRGNVMPRTRKVLRIDLSVRQASYRASIHRATAGNRSLCTYAATAKKNRHPHGWRILYRFPGFVFGAMATKRGPSADTTVALGIAIPASQGTS